uniref:Small ribosomal subunit protein bS6m n=1 Tax=Ornithorhynchus anatinus TaxID=9258 RepID=A0A6I8NHR9_ORNAN
MPRYELALILKATQRPETAAILKRTINALMERGAIVRNLENLGERNLPYKISIHSQRHVRGGSTGNRGRGPALQHPASGRIVLEIPRSSPPIEASVI